MILQKDLTFFELASVLFLSIVWTSFLPLYLCLCWCPVLSCFSLLSYHVWFLCFPPRPILLQKWISSTPRIFFQLMLSTLLFLTIHIWLGLPSINKCLYFKIKTAFETLLLLLFSPFLIHFLFIICAFAVSFTDLFFPLYPPFIVAHFFPLLSFFYNNSRAQFNFSYNPQCAAADMKNMYLCEWVWLACMGYN